MNEGFKKFDRGPRPLISNRDHPIYPEPRSVTVSISLEGLAPGSGWFISHRVIVTAAHVVGAPAFKNMRILTPSGDVITNVESVRYLAGSFQRVRMTSDNDVAVIVLQAEVPQAPVLSVGTYRKGEVVILHGHEGTQPHQSEGESAALRPYLCYSSGTEEGFSGCPVMCGDEVVAIHLGSLNSTAPEALKKWPPELIKPGAVMNYGVLIENEVLTFLLGERHD